VKRKQVTVTKDKSREQLMVKTWLRNANIADLNPRDFKGFSSVSIGFVCNLLLCLYIHSIKRHSSSCFCMVAKYRKLFK
jgi:hypothetical protein